MKNQELISAYLLAEHAHRVLPRKPENAFRKYKRSTVPYITHPVSVTFRVMDLPGYVPLWGKVSLLHDVLEDTLLTPTWIEELGTGVLEGVTWLTSYSKRIGSTAKRAERKDLDRKHLATAPHWVKWIKLLDREDNLLDLEGAPSNFIRLYCAETIKLIEAIGTDNQTAIEISKRLSDRAHILEEANK